MNCNPSSLAAAAACYTCIPKPVMQASMISLLCEWANHLTPPGAMPHWEPESRVASWTDGLGGHSGDWATYAATVDLATQITLLIPGGFLGQITSLTGIQNIPNLQTLDCHGNLLSGTLDLSGLTQLSIVYAGDNQLTEVNCTNCSALTYIAVSVNQLGDLYLNGCPLTVTFFGASNPLLVVHGP